MRCVKKSENSSSSLWLLPPISFSSIAMTEEEFFILNSSSRWLLPPISFSSIVMKTEKAKMQMRCVKIRKLVVFTLLPIGFSRIAMGTEEEQMQMRWVKIQTQHHLLQRRLHCGYRLQSVLAVLPWGHLNNSHGEKRWKMRWRASTHISFWGWAMAGAWTNFEPCKNHTTRRLYCGSNRF